jgi:hypothetical protein
MRMLDASRFQDADKYAAYVETPTGRLRSEIAWENVCRFLPRNTSKRRVLDVGGGIGCCEFPVARFENGVRVFFDYLDSENLAEAAYSRIFELESALGVRPEFAAIARYIQAIARHSCASSSEATGP